MRTHLIATAELYQQARAHLDAHPERIGFFLADWSAQHRQFNLEAWRSIPDEEVEFGDSLTVALTDEAQANVIAWASSGGKSLVEAHSHGGPMPAGFSVNDMLGFREWIPHLWWRLQGRPYAAVVTGVGTFDALAWVRGPHSPDQVYEFVVEGRVIEATTQTLRAGCMGRKRGGRRGREAL